MARAIFYTHQTSGVCAGMCACDRTHQIEKTEIWVAHLKKHMLQFLLHFSILTKNADTRTHLYLVSNYLHWVWRLTNKYFCFLKSRLFLQSGVLFKWACFCQNTFNSLTPGVYEKVIHTLTNL